MNPAPESFCNAAWKSFGSNVVEIGEHNVPALIQRAWEARVRVEDVGCWSLATVRAERAAAAPVAPVPAPIDTECHNTLANASQHASPTRTVRAERAAAKAAAADRYRSTCHRDGTATVWDVYAQRWRVVANPRDAAVVALGSEERARVLRHLARGAR